MRENHECIAGEQGDGAIWLQLLAVQIGTSRAAQILQKVAAVPFENSCMMPADGCLAEHNIVVRLSTNPHTILLEVVILESVGLDLVSLLHMDGSARRSWKEISQAVLDPRSPIGGIWKRTVKTVEEFDFSARVSLEPLENRDLPSRWDC